MASGTNSMVANYLETDRENNTNLETLLQSSNVMNSGRAKTKCELIKQLHLKKEDLRQSPVTNQHIETSNHHETEGFNNLDKEVSLKMDEEDTNDGAGDNNEQNESLKKLISFLTTNTSNEKKIINESMTNNESHNVNHQIVNIVKADDNITVIKAVSDASTFNFSPDLVSIVNSKKDSPSQVPKNDPISIFPDSSKSIESSLDCSISSIHCSYGCTTSVTSSTTTNAIGTTLPQMLPLLKPSSSIQLILPPTTSLISSSPQWVLGDMLWGKVSGHPWWPCMVAMDPSHTMYKKDIIRRNKTSAQYHVQFFGDEGERGWLNESALMPFRGRQDFELIQQEVLNMTIGSNAQLRKDRQGFIINPRRQNSWNLATSYAETAYKMELTARIRRYTYVYNDIQMNKAKEKLEQRKRKAATNNNSDSDNVNVSSGCNTNYFNNSDNDVHNSSIDKSLDEPPTKKQKLFATKDDDEEEEMDDDEEEDGSQIAVSLAKGTPRSGRSIKLTDKFVKHIEDVMKMKKKGSKNKKENGDTSNKSHNIANIPQQKNKKIPMLDKVVESAQQQDISIFDDLKIKDEPADDYDYQCMQDANNDNVNSGKDNNNNDDKRNKNNIDVINNNLKNNDNNNNSINNNINVSDNSHKTNNVTNKMIFINKEKLCDKLKKVMTLPSVISATTTTTAATPSSTTVATTNITNKANNNNNNKIDANNAGNLIKLSSLLNLMKKNNKPLGTITIVTSSTTTTTHPPPTISTTSLNNNTITSSPTNNNNHDKSKTSPINNNNKTPPMTKNEPKSFIKCLNYTCPLPTPQHKSPKQQQQQQQQQQQLLPQHETPAKNKVIIIKPRTSSPSSPSSPTIERHVWSQLLLGNSSNNNNNNKIDNTNKNDNNNINNSINADEIKQETYDGYAITTPTKSNQITTPATATTKLTPTVNKIQTSKDNNTTSNNIITSANNGISLTNNVITTISKNARTGTNNNNSTSLMATTNHKIIATSDNTSTRSCKMTSATKSNTSATSKQNMYTILKSPPRRQTSIINPIVVTPTITSQQLLDNNKTIILNDNTSTSKSTKLISLSSANQPLVSIATIKSRNILTATATLVRSIGVNTDIDAKEFTQIVNRSRIVEKNDSMMQTDVEDSFNINDNVNNINNNDDSIHNNNIDHCDNNNSDNINNDNINNDNINSSFESTTGPITLTISTRNSTPQLDVENVTPSLSPESIQILTLQLDSDDRNDNKFTDVNVSFDSSFEKIDEDVIKMSNVTKNDINNTSNNMDVDNVAGDIKSESEDVHIEYSSNNTSYENAFDGDDPNTVPNNNNDVDSTVANNNDNNICNNFNVNVSNITAVCNNNIISDDKNNSNVSINNINNVNSNINNETPSNNNKNDVVNNTYITSSPNNNNNDDNNNNITNTNNIDLNVEDDNSDNNNISSANNQIANDVNNDVDNINENNINSVIDDSIHASSNNNNICTDDNNDANNDNNDVNVNNDNNDVNVNNDNNDVNVNNDINENFVDTNDHGGGLVHVLVKWDDINNNKDNNNNTINNNITNNSNISNITNIINNNNNNNGNLSSNNNDISDDNSSNESNNVNNNVKINIESGSNINKISNNGDNNDCKNNDNSYYNNGNNANNNDNNNKGISNNNQNNNNNNNQNTNNNNNQNNNSNNNQNNNSSNSNNSNNSDNNNNNSSNNNNSNNSDNSNNSSNHNNENNNSNNNSNSSNNNNNDNSDNNNENNNNKQNNHSPSDNKFDDIDESNNIKFGNYELVGVLWKKKNNNNDGDEDDEDDDKSNNNINENDNCNISLQQICSICEIPNDNSSTNNNKMIRCEGPCNNYYHLSCAGVVDAGETSFRCHQCSTGCHMCFVCKRSTKDTICCSYNNDNPINKHTNHNNKCKKYYHLDCLSKYQQTSLNTNHLVCPSHTCITCSGKHKQAGKGKMYQCIKCPRSYHVNQFCLPASCQILTNHDAAIICDAHLTGHDNEDGFNKACADWCFVCFKEDNYTDSTIEMTSSTKPTKQFKGKSKTTAQQQTKGRPGESLVTCSTCPLSFHPSCVKLSPTFGAIKCRDCCGGGGGGGEGLCSSGGLVYYGDVVWAKLGNQRWWPSEIINPVLDNNIINTVSNNNSFNTKQRQTNGFVLVKLYSHGLPYWMSRFRLLPYQEGDHLSRQVPHQIVHAPFTDALMEASMQLSRRLLSRRQEFELDEKLSNKPEYYKHVKTNIPIGDVEILKGAPFENPACQCTININKTNNNNVNTATCNSNNNVDEHCCGLNSDCINRTMMFECHPLVCAGKDKCLNQCFTKRMDAETRWRKTSDKGWGLYSKTHISKGQFIGEYVGDLIDVQESKRRLEEAQMKGISNYYMLTLDKNRVIDAGPKGNHTRFMNHSCEPNCETQKWTVNGDVRIGLFALHDIPADTELTFNYNFDCCGTGITKCKCGSSICSGYLGVRPKTAAAWQVEKRSLEIKMKKLQNNFNTIIVDKTKINNKQIDNKLNKSTTNINKQTTTININKPTTNNNKPTTNINKPTTNNNKPTKTNNNKSTTNINKPTTTNNNKSTTTTNNKRNNSKNNIKSKKCKLDSHLTQ